MENLGIASVAAITVITYLMGMAVRASRMDNKWIPILCGLLGGLLGLVSFYLLPIPDYPAGDPITAAAVGIVSGLAATGLHQAAKQLSKEWDDALALLPEGEEAIERFIRSKCKGKPLDRETQRKLAAALQRRGFSWQEIRPVLNRLGEEMAEE